ncbi:MAG: hypothetical protein LBC31_11880 [Treponema sp.]|jgi:hypothetical protein|nr:hypothetical protein [Treponema sp.]
MKFVQLLAVLFFIPLCAEAQGASAVGKPELYREANVKKLIEKYDVIYAKVDALTEGSKTWVPMEADVHICTAVPLEKIKAVITDYDNYTGIFRRSTASRILSRDARGTTAFFEITVGAMGVTVVTAYTVLLETPLDSPGKFLLTFSHAGDNGSIRKVYGFWYLESIMIDGKPYTYLRYYSTSEPLRVNVLQRQITSWFIGSEYGSMLKDVITAAGRR